MTSNAYDDLPAPQGRGTAWTILIGGVLLILLTLYLAIQPVNGLQHMAPLVWWGILGFLGLLGLLMLFGGSFLLRSLGRLNQQLAGTVSAFDDSLQSSYRGVGLSVQNFQDSTQIGEAPPIGVASLRPRPFEGVDPADDVPAQFTDSQLSADRGFRTSEAGALPPIPAAGAVAAPTAAAATATAAAWQSTIADEPTPAAVAATGRPSGNFAPPESTTPSQFGSLPTAPAAFERETVGERDAATEFWIPALQSAPLGRYTAMVDRLFTQAGFVTQAQTLSAPGMSAIWLFSRSQLGAPVSLVLCEHGSPEGLDAHRLEELREVMATHRIRRGQFATTAPVSPALQALATQYAINLLDTPRLLQTVSKRRAEQQGELWHLIQGE